MKSLNTLFIGFIFLTVLLSCEKNKPTQESTEIAADTTDTTEVITPTFESGENFKTQFNGFYTAYLKLSEAFVASDAVKVTQEAGQISKTLSNFNTDGLNDAAGQAWKSASTEIEIALRDIGTSHDVEVQRAAFSTISNQMYQLIKDFGITDQKAYYTFCPMAFNDKGGYWISSQEEIRNPYFGDKMLTCGVVKEELN
jgi:hypothetical protein